MGQAAALARRLLPVVALCGKEAKAKKEAGEDVKAFLAEKVYINGQLISSKDIQLLIKPIQFVTLGQNAEGNWPFSGYLHALKIWDEALPLKDK